MSHHTLLHGAVRPLVALLARTGIAPDLVTGLRLATGLAAAGCLGIGHGPAMATGAALFALSLLLDRTDGALARATGRFSRRGPILDLASDCVSTMALFVGLGYGVGARPGGMATATGLGLGMLAAVSVAVTFVSLSRQEGPGATATRWLDPDDAMLAVPFVIWFGQAPLLLFLAALLSPIAAAVALLLGVLRRRPAPAYAVGRPSRPSRSVSSS